jgi:hypothetical protein
LGDHDTPSANAAAAWHRRAAAEPQKAATELGPSRLAWRDRETLGRQDKGNARRNHLKRSNRVARRHCCRLAAVVGAGTTGLATRRLRSPGSKTEIALGACPLVHWPLRARRTIASAPLAGKGVIHELRGMPAKSSTKFRPTRPGCGQLPPSSWRPTAIPAGAARRQRCPSAATFARPPCSPRRGLPPAARYGREASL